MNNQPKSDSQELTTNQIESAGSNGSLGSTGGEGPRENVQVTRQRLGAALRDARLRSGMSEDAVAQITRITRSYIVALEAGEFEKLPGAVFGRGFVRSIARLLGLDQEEYSRLYAECWAVDQMQNSLRAPAAEGAISQRLSSRRKLKFDLGTMLQRRPLPSIKFDGQKQMALLIAAPALAVIAAVAVVVLRQGKPAPRAKVAVQAPVASVVEARVETQDIPQEAQPATAREGNNAVVVTPLEKTTPTTNSPPVVVQSQAPAPQPQVAEEPPMELRNEKAAFEQVLELVVIEPVKIKLVQDGKAPAVKQLKPDAYRFTFSDRAELTVYDAAAIEVAYNGRSLGSLGAKGRIRKLIFQTGGPESAAAAQVAPEQVGENVKKL